MKNLIKYDKCGKIEETIWDYYLGMYNTYLWRKTDIGDLCPDCYEEYKKLLEEFKNKQICK